jgi:hypothetical protein
MLAAVILKIEIDRCAGVLPDWYYVSVFEETYIYPFIDIEFKSLPYEPKKKRKIFVILLYSILCNIGAWILPKLLKGFRF